MALESPRARRLKEMAETEALQGWESGAHPLAHGLAVQ